MKISAVQMTPTTDPAANLERIREFTGEAAAEGARLIVFPEQSMVLLQSVTVSDLNEIAVAWWPSFERLTRELAREHGVWIITAGFEPAPAGLPLNTMLAVGPDGSELARYRKLHLFEGFAASESAHTQAGTKLPPVFDVEFGGEHLRVGLANCYDIRFPELFRSLIDRGVNTIVVSAAWASGPGKEDHWRVLTQARAIENVSWLVGSATVGGGSRNAATVGHTRVVDPLGTVIADLGPRGEGVLTAEVSVAVVDQARSTLPVLENRKLKLAYSL